MIIPPHSDPRFIMKRGPSQIRRLTLAGYNEIVRRLWTREDAKSIAKDFQLSRVMIWKIRTENKIPRPPLIAATKRDRIRALTLEGLSPYTIQERLGLTRNHVTAEQCKLRAQGLLPKLPNAGQKAASR